VDALARDTRHHVAASYPDLRDYLEELNFEGKSAVTLAGYERQLRRLLLDHPQLAFADFDKAAVMHTLARVPERSRYITKSVYRGWFAWGVREDKLATNPVDKLRKLPHATKRPSNVFTEAEVALLESRPDRVLWLLLFRIGLRRAEACNLQRQDIDLERMRVTVRNGKRGKDAVVPFDHVPELAMAVADMDLLDGLHPTDYMWTRPSYRRDGRVTPVGSTTFQRWYSAELEAAGIAYRNPHQTRHTFHWLLRHVQDLPLESRQLMLRHDSPETTVRQYPVVDTDDVARELAAFGAGR
jgi:integrase/recombinase XerD